VELSHKQLADHHAAGLMGKGKRPGVTEYNKVRMHERNTGGGRGFARPRGEGGLRYLSEQEYLVRAQALRPGGGFFGPLVSGEWRASKKGAEHGQ